MAAPRADQLRHRCFGERRAHLADLQIIGGIWSDNGNAPPIFSQTYKALLCTASLTMDDALTRICTIVSETNTNGRTRAAMVLVAIGSSPPPRTGDRVKFCVT